MNTNIKNTEKWLDDKTVSYTTSADGLVYVDGDITIPENEEVTLDALAEVSGYVYVQQGATFSAPALTKSGSVDVRQGATFSAPALTKSGSVDVRQGATFSAPALTEVSGYVYVQQGATFSAPALTKSGSVDVRQGATFSAPALTKSGSVDVRQGATFSAPALTKSGYVYVQQGATFSAPALTKSGSVDVRQGATFSAPALTKSGSVDVRQGATFSAPALTKSGSVDVRQGATFSAPALTKSGSVDVRQGATFSAPALVTIGHVAYETTIFGHEVKLYDEMGCVAVSEKTRDGITIRLCRKAEFKDSNLVGEKYFVVSQGEHNAHGETLEAAMADLMFKTADRDVLKYRNMPADTVKSPFEWATVYRIVTGACQYGTQSFMKQKGELKESYTLAEIIAQTSGAYGSEKFRSIVAPNGIKQAA